MASEKSKSKEYDLDQTDKLPILVSAMFDAEVADDAVPLEDASEAERLDRAVRMDLSDGEYEEPPLERLPAPVTRNVTPSPHADFVRPSSVDLPALAESMRSVEQRIAQQHVDYESLSRNFERARDAEMLASSRANALEQDMATLRSSLELEQQRVLEHERALSERRMAADVARERAAQAMQDMERHQSEAKTLRDELASRDATIVEVLHSLGERDAQLSSLQQEHVKLQQALDARIKLHSQVESELTAAKSRGEDLTRQLSGSSDTGVALGAKIRRAEVEINNLRAELGAARAQSATYMEALGTREFRRGFDENLFRELDTKVNAAAADQSALAGERDRLRSAHAALEKKFADQTTHVEALQASNAAHTATMQKQAQDLKRSEGACTDLSQKFSAAESERARLAVDLAERSAALAEARAAASGDVQRINQRLEMAEQHETQHRDQIAQLHNDHSAKISKLQNDHLSKVGTIQSDYIARTSQLQSEHASQIASLQDQHKAKVAELTAQAEERDQEMTVLMAHLKEARRPMEPVEDEVKRLNEELAAKARVVEALAAEANELRAALERAKGALEEREFLIRRLERAETTNANVMGRIQTNMERLGSTPAAPTDGVLPEFAAELIRVDGDHNISHTLSRRTRIGRAAGCELQVDSTSVSRHHALIVAGARDTVIEDLNSTNGVILNGRKVSRAFLNDGDLIVIGDVHFRYATNPSGQQTSLEPPPKAS